MIYSGRQEALVGPLIERFRQQTGIATSVRYGNTAQLTAQLLEEGTATRPGRRWCWWMNRSARSIPD